MNTFDTLTLRTELLHGIASQNFTTMTDIQAQSLPAILEGQDIIAQAKTGSGKTLAFAIGILNRIDTTNSSVQALVLVPTRELAQQVSEAIKLTAVAIPNCKIATLYGGVPLNAQAKALANGAQIVVATPGRLADHIGKQTIQLSTVVMLVLDEADRMVDMGFIDDIKRIVSHTKKARQTLLFSATFESQLEDVKSSFMRDALEIVVSNNSQANTQIDEHFYACDTHSKQEALLTLLGYYNPANVLIFFNTKQALFDVSSYLEYHGIMHKSLTGELDQPKRDSVLLQFVNGSTKVLLATDVASRGLDIDALDTVINYEVPFKMQVYKHRIGRTGRADKFGTAITLVGKSDQKHFESLQEYKQSLLTTKPLPQKSTPYDSKAQFTTLVLLKGKKDKLRKGDIMGALCNHGAIDAQCVGDIRIHATQTFVAICQDKVANVLEFLIKERIKKLKIKAYVLK